MSIHPEYADAIFSGRKLVELRKRAIASDVSTVLVYATSPVQRIIGEFRVAAVVSAPPQELWPRVCDIAAITKRDFDAYYGASNKAVGIMVASTRLFPVAVALDDLEPALPVPQSFTYVPEDALTRVYSFQVHQKSLLDRIAALLRAVVDATRPDVAKRVLPRSRRGRSMAEEQGAVQAEPPTTRLRRVRSVSR
jgi:predicted transcriptional regulator